ncbi:MAG: hypothetical protein QXJ64_08790 [Thermosphaera sp.]
MGLEIARINKKFAIAKLKAIVEIEEALKQARTDAERNEILAILSRVKWMKLSSIPLLIAELDQKYGNAQGIIADLVARIKEIIASELGV